MVVGSIYEAVSYVREIIEENPSSSAAKAEVERKLQEVIGQTSKVRSYTPDDFRNLVLLSILVVGYSRRGISDSQRLSSVASSVPDSLGIEAVFPVIEEDGNRRLWYQSDMASDFNIAHADHGRTAALEILKKFGNYALFMAGLMSDVLRRNKRKGGVDIRYYESTGAHAFRSIAEAKGDEVADLETVVWIADNFHDTRTLMNEAGMIIGTFSRIEFMELLMNERGIGDAYIIPRGPMKDSRINPEKQHPENTFGEHYTGMGNFSLS